jgi:hypothetical protein
MTGPTRRELAPPIDLPGLAAQGARLIRQVGGPFALIGGAALQAYGLDRYTKDVDFAVTEAQTARALALWTGEHRLLRIGGVSLITDEAAIDLVDRRVELRALFEEAIAAAAKHGYVVHAGGEDVPVVPMEYLVAMKIAAPRSQDEADLAFLLEQSSLDYDQARDIVKRHLGFVVTRYLDRMARQAGRTDVRADYDED